MQETWRLGHEDVADNDGSVFVGRGLDEKPCRRGSQGVGLWLSRGAAEAWETAGRAVLAATPRLLAIRLSVHDARGRHVSLVLASGYAPHSGMDLAVSDAYYADVDALHAGLRQDDVLVFGTDANATIGIEKSHLPRRSRGPNGLDYINNAGRRFLAWLSANGLASAASFYVSGLASDATWFHPRSRLPHAPDHFVVRTCDIKRVVNCRKFTKLKLESCWSTLTTSNPVKLTLRVTRRLKKRLTRPAPRRDWSVLRGRDDDARRERAAFHARVQRHYRDTAPAPTRRATRSQSATIRTRIDRATHRPVAARVGANSARTARLTAALAFASEPLPRRPKPSPDWFIAAAGLRTLIDKRNEAQLTCF